MGRLLQRIWVVMVVLLIAFLGFSSQLFIVAPSFPSSTDPSLLRLLVPFNALLAALFLNYYLTVSTDPGRVPARWEPDWRQMENGEMEVKKLTGGPRYCRTCRGPWVNNCVGHANYGHFCRFLFFVDAACSYHLWMITTRAFGSLAFFTNPSTFQMVILVMNYVACVPVLFAVGVFSLFHLWSVLTNATTIEGWEKDKVASLKRRGKIREYRYPYHLGYLNNLKAVLGPNILLWCWPQRTPGDGLSYPTAVGTSKKDQLLWPPRDEHVRPRRRPPPPDTAFTYGSGLKPSLLSSFPSSSLPLPSDPDLLQRRSRPKAAKRAPWMSGSEDEAASGAAGAVDEESDDDVPLGSLSARQPLVCPGGAHGAVEEDEADERASFAVPQPAGERDTEEEDLDPDRGVRIRRGSEGYEIRPRMPWAGAAPPAQPVRPYRPLRPEEHGEVQEQSEDDESWGGVDSVGEEGEEGESEWEVDEDGDRRRVGQRYRYYVREEDSESDLESLASFSGEEGG
ncbi:Palmitoyltransferase [Rhodosporidiobolus nylandii]